MSKNILAISGSLRDSSFNTMLLRAAQNLVPEGASIEIASIGDLPLYNEDIESNFPSAAQTLKDKILAADGVIISTPEYNRSISSALKNAIEWTSRPYGQGAWKGKPVLVLGATVAHTGTLAAQCHLKQILSYLDAKFLGQPEFYLSAAQEKFAQDGTLIDEDTKIHLRAALEALLVAIG
jgi:chromate reductase, NAD(P)H dehydrogenase (quinone)